MAKPQLENGFTRIANEIIEVICGKISYADWIRVILFTIRVTWGFHKKETNSNYISYARKLNKTEKDVKILLSDMTDRKIIRFYPVGEFNFIISFNKNYEEWKV